MNKSNFDKIKTKKNNLTHTVDDTYENDDYIFFWGSIFSNWAKASFIYKGEKYNCAEQAMMAEKAIMFNDMPTLKDIMNSNNPRQQKALGREVAGFNKQLWESKCLPLVSDICFQKFSQNEHLRDRLLSTGKKKIVEASPSDDIWGIGLHAEDHDILDESKWKGKNWLGIALMNARDRLNGIVEE